MILQFNMAVRPEWMCVSSVDLSPAEKESLWNTCKWLKLECKCNSVNQCGTKCQYFCCLCNDIVNSPEPKVQISDKLCLPARILASLNLFDILKLKLAANLLG